MAVGSVGGVEGLEVELLDRVDHEPGEVVVCEPVAEVRRQKHRLVAVAGEEVLSHAWIVHGVPDEKGRSAGGLCDSLSLKREPPATPASHTKQKRPGDSGDAGDAGVRI